MNCRQHEKQRKIRRSKPTSQAQGLIYSKSYPCKCSLLLEQGQENIVAPLISN